MKIYDSTAKTIEEAISAGLEKLGASIGDVTIDVLQEGSKGLFGLFGSRQAKVRLTLKEDEGTGVLDNLTGSKKAAPAPKPEAQPKQQRPAPTEKPARAAAAQADTPSRHEGASRPKPVERKAAPAPKEKSEKPQSQLPFKPMEKPVVTMLAEEDIDTESAPARARDFLKELTRLMGVDVTLQVGTDAEGNVFINMHGDTLGILIGRRGETLDALQYLTSLKVNRGQEGYTRVTLNTENYREKREEALTRLANRMANRAIRTGRKVNLEPMNPYERRILHSALQANEQVDTHSEGEEPNRHVVITLRK